MADDNVQHGIDDDSSGDAAKGAALGGLGGAAVGAAAGSLIGPVGTVIGAAVGAISGAVGSGAAVAAVDAVDNDNTVSGVGGGSSGGGSGQLHSSLREGGEGGGHNIVTGGEAETDAGKGGLATGALAGGVIGAAVGGPVGAVVGGTVGSLAGGVAGDASEADDMSGTTGGTESYGSSSYGGTTGSVLSSGPLQDDMGAVAGGGANLASSLRETDRDVMRVPVVEEELHVDKEMRQAGEVEVTKRVVEEQVSVPVTVQREEVVVTRHAVDRPVSSTEISGDALQDGETIRVPVREEVAVVSKEAHVVEEVEIAKTRVAEQQTVSDTVRREEVEIDDSTRTGGSMGSGSSI